VSERREWRNVVVLSATILFTITSIYSWTHLRSLHLRGLGASEVEVGWGFFALTLAYRLPQALGGWLADRFSRKASVVLGTFGMGAAYVGVALAPRWELVVAAICGAWVMGALQWPALASLVASSVPDRERGRAMGMLEACSTAGVTLGPLVGETALRGTDSLAGAWRILLLGSCAVYAGCGLVRLFLLRDVPSSSPEEGRMNLPWRLLAVPMAVTAATFAVFYLTIDGPVLGWYVVDVTGGTPETVQEIGFYGGLVAIGGAVAAGWLADRIGAGRTMAVALVATAVLLAPFALGAPASRRARTILGLLFLTGEFYVVAYQKLVTSLGPRHRRGLAVGIVGTVVGVASSWSMLAAGGLYRLDRGAPLVWAAGLQALAAVAGLLLCRRAFNA
jgi:MFS family permease